MERAERIYYNGYWINIFYDNDCDPPNTWGDENLFLVHYHSQCWIEEKKLVSQDEIRDWYRDENDEIEKRYWIWPVAAYIHSGVVLSIGAGSHFPDYRFDVSHVGAVLASKEEFETEEEAHKVCKGLIETWNQYLSGEIFGYDIEDSEDEMIGYGCSGFYGDYESSGLLAEAKSEIDAEIEERCKDAIEMHQTQLQILASLQPTNVY